MNVSKLRQAKHAGSWYPLQNELLSKELDEFFSKVKTDDKIKPKAVKAIIGPHAGYKYSGLVAAWAYQYLQKSPIKKPRVFILGPSHHKYFQGCSLTSCKQLETPLGNLQVDEECVKELNSELVNTEMTKSEQEKEHSIQMHLPMIRRIFQDKATVVPIIVGVLNEKLAHEYGKRFAKYFEEENSLFIISSDFCHWGAHFAYQPFKEGVEIHKFITELDKKGMELIEDGDCEGFDEYIEETGNTICGEFPIRILMHTIRQSSAKLKTKTKFVKYDQSDQVMSFHGSSVSYAAGVVHSV